MSKNHSFQGGKIESGMFRFYCNDNQDCRLAEKTLREANIPFVKIEAKNQGVPLLVTAQQTCRGLGDIEGFTTAFKAIKEKYSINWS